MPRAKVISIDEHNEGVVYMKAYSSGKGSTNIKELHRRKEFLDEAMSRELTERQRLFVTEYYLEGKNIPQIAKEYSLNRSTVSRHLSAAKKKLSRFAYYIN